MNDMELTPDDQKVVDLLSKLKNSNGKYPSDILEARRQAYLKQVEEAKKRDHRKLGKELDLFSIQELAGPGLIFFHPKGGIIRKQLEDWMRDEYLKRGYSLVYTPHIARLDLWKTSGHASFYAENMFKPMELDDAEYQLKPMR